MPKVMIEMQMPKGCGWCRFYTEDENYLSYCVAKSSERWMIPEIDLSDTMPSWCPLKECK